MEYALNIEIETGRVLSATYAEYATQDAVFVNRLPNGNLLDYLFIDGEYVYQPLPVIEHTPLPTQLDRIEAQITYTAMMTDTLLEE